MTRRSYPLIAMIAPALLVLVVLALVPTVYAVNISLQDRELSNPDSVYVWFENFAALFSDRRFLNSLRVSLIWEVVTVTATMLTSTLLAILMFETVSPRRRNLLCLVLILPILLPRVSAAFVWKFAFHPLFGLATYPYKVVTGEPIDVMASPATALSAVALVDVWQWACSSPSSSSSCSKRCRRSRSRPRASTARGPGRSTPMSRCRCSRRR